MCYSRVLVFSVVVWGLIALPEIQAAQNEASSAQPTTKPAASPEADKDKPTPKYRCDNSVFEFPQAWSGDIIKNTYIIHNDGAAPLEIIKASSSCGCTVAKNYDKIIGPGKEGRIPVTFNTRGKVKGKPKTFRQRITLTTNDPNTPKAILTITGEIRPRVSISPEKGAIWDRVLMDETDPKVLTRKIKLINNTSTPLQPKMLPSRVKSIFDAEIKEIEPGKVSELTITTKGPFKQGINQAYLRIHTGIKEDPFIRVHCRLFAVSLISARPAFINIGSPPKRDYEREITVTYNGKKSLKVTSVQVSDPALKAKLRTAQAGKRYVVTLTIPAGFDLAPDKSAQIEMDTGLEEMPKFVIPIKKYVRPQQPKAKKATTPNYLIGKFAPTEVVKTPEGQEIQLGPDMQQVAVVNFWASWCKNCKKQLPLVEQVAKTYAAKGVKFINISTDSMRPGLEVLNYAKQLGITMPIALDPKRIASKKYLASKIPTLYVIGKNGVIEAVHQGTRSGLTQDLPEQLDTLLAGKTRKDFPRAITASGATSGTDTLATTSQKPAGVALAVDSLKQDTGRHKPGATVKYRLYYRNDGQKDLIIKSVIASEAVKILPGYPKTLQSGKSGAVVCEFTAPQQPKPFNHNVVLISNDPKRPRLRISLTGATRPYFEIDPPNGVNFGRWSPSQVRPALASVIYNGEGKVQYLSAESSSPNFTVKLAPMKLVPNNATLIVEAKPPFKPGPNIGFIQVKTDCKEQPVLRVPVRLYLPPRIDIYPLTIIANKTPRPQQKMVKISYNGEGSLNILGVKPSHPHIKTQFYPLEDGKSYRLRVTVPPNFDPPGGQASITLRTDDRERPEIVLPIKIIGSTAAQRPPSTDHEGHNH